MVKNAAGILFNPPCGDTDLKSDAALDFSSVEDSTGVEEVVGT